MQVECAEYQQQENRNTGQTTSSIAAVIQEAEAESRVREEVSLDVVLLDCVVDVMGQAHVLSCRPTALILVSRYVSTEIECTEAVACYGLLGTATLCYFDADVVAFGALFAEETDAPPIKLLSATWLS